MEWRRLYAKDQRPTLADISEFINNDLWRELNDYLQSAYHLQPMPAYSKCPMQKG